MNPLGNNAARSGALTSNSRKNHLTQCCHWFLKRESSRAFRDGPVLRQDLLCCSATHVTLLSGTASRLCFFGSEKVLGSGLYLQQKNGEWR